MKKALLAIALFCASTAMVHAQSFVTQSGSADTVSKAYEAGDMKVYNYLRSNSNANVTITWRINAIDTSGGWHFGGFCDNELCYTVPFGVLENNYTATYGPEYEDFHAVFNGDDAAPGSSAWVRVRVIDPATGDFRNLTFIAYKSPAGITTTVTSKEVALWPNPASGAVNISFNPNAGIRRATIYNTIGKVVSQFRVQGSSAKLDVSSLPAGIYMLRLTNAQGQSVGTKRFTVK